MRTNNFSDFIHNPFIWSLLTIIVALAIIKIAGKLIARIVRRIVPHQRYENKIDEKKREDTVIKVMHTLASVIVWIVAVVVILNALGVNLAALATGAGVFGVVIGLGAQNTIRDFLAGLFILIENQYRVGDVVTLAGGTTGAIGTSGLVEDITLRITKLRDLDGTLNIIRNGEASIITNRTFKYSSVVLDLLVPYDSDIDTVEKVINEVGLAVAGHEKFSKLTVEPIQFLRVEKFAPEGVTVRAVGKVSPAAQWDTAGYYRRLLLPALKRHGVHLAVPNITVHNDKKPA